MNYIEISPVVSDKKIFKFSICFLTNHEDLNTLCRGSPKEHFCYTEIGPSPKEYFCQIILKF